MERVTGETHVTNYLTPTHSGEVEAGPAGEGPKTSGKAVPSPSPSYALAQGKPPHLCVRVPISDKGDPSGDASKLLLCWQGRSMGLGDKKAGGKAVGGLCCS